MYYVFSILLSFIILLQYRYHVLNYYHWTLVIKYTVLIEFVYKEIL